MNPLLLQSKILWNAFDEKALLVGLERKPGETNVELRNRVVNRIDGSNTKDGLADWTLDLFDYQVTYPDGMEKDVTENHIFYSKYTPLSKHRYDQIRKPDVAYEYPVIYDFEEDAEYVLEYTDALKDSSVDLKWLLYKNANLSYSQIWSNTYITKEVELRYQTLINDEIFNIVESPRRPE